MNDPQVASATLEDLLQRFPTLAKSKDLNEKRGELTLKASDACFTRSYNVNDCYQRLAAIVDKGDAAFAFKAGKLAVRKINAYSSVTFFKKAVAGQAAAKECADEDLQRATIAALGLPPSDPKVNDAKVVAIDTCFAQMKDKLIENLASGGYYQDNACALLKDKKVLSELQAARCTKKP